MSFYGGIFKMLILEYFYPLENKKPTLFVTCEFGFGGKNIVDSNVFVILLNTFSRWRCDESRPSPQQRGLLSYCSVCTVVSHCSSWAVTTLLNAEQWGIRWTHLHFEPFALYVHSTRTPRLFRPNTPVLWPYRCICRYIYVYIHVIICIYKDIATLLLSNTESI